MFDYLVVKKGRIHHRIRKEKKNIIWNHKIRVVYNQIGRSIIPQIILPVIEGGEIYRLEEATVFEDGDEVAAKRDLRSSLVPTDELGVAGPRPLREEKLERGGRACVNGKGGDGWEAEVETESEEAVVVNGEGGEKRVTHEERKERSEVGDGSEAAGEEVEVTRCRGE
ncbi:unnamed protein product [Eruca vesicaria subsp. sativa]|uniref:Uncharacterized protein n=1 Tax=Eruca vesicaria subsp. sativa TaxID=29727 RepID=A0ABC8JHC1_ERUVS|nr:unnamed protein product [Eruca vesicaria subsp. sativa]